MKLNSCEIFVFYTLIVTQKKENKKKGIMKHIITYFSVCAIVKLQLAE